MATKIIIIFATLFTVALATKIEVESVTEPTKVHLIDGIVDTFGIEYIFNFNKDHQQQCSEIESETTFSIYDYVVVGAMLIISLGIGVFYGFFDKKSEATSSDFMLGSEMKIFPVTLSLTTSFITAIELLGNPAEMYFYGSQYALIIIAMILVIPVALKYFYPIYDTMKLTSCYEYLGVRFGKELRVFGGVLYIFQMCFYTSVAVLAPGIALSKATGIDMRLAIVLIYIVCIFYSSQGGLKAVVIADTFQTCVLVVALLLVLVLGTYMQEGGISAIFQINYERGRLDVLDFDPNPTKRHTVWSVVVGGFFYWASLLCANQATVQKAMSLRSLSKAKIALTLSVFGLATLFFINFYTGWMIFAHYETCDPLKSGMIGGQDQLIPFYVMDTFKQFTAFSGIFVAGVFAASLGTVAAALSSLSAVTLEDLCISGMNVKITPEQATRYAKWLNFGFGVLSFGLVFLVQGRGILQATLTLNGLIGGITLGLFSLGIFFKRANLKGALYGGLLSTLIVITLGIFSLTYGEEAEYLETSIEGCSCLVNVNATTPAVEILVDANEPWYTSLYQISYMWYSFIGTMLTIALGLISSIITQYISERNIRKLTSTAGMSADKTNEIFRQCSFSITDRTVSLIAHNMAHEVSMSTAKIENSLRRALSGAHITHANANAGDDDRMRIVNDDQKIAHCFVIQIFDDGKEFNNDGVDNPAIDISDEGVKTKI